jgi:hypothetical protein
MGGGMALLFAEDGVHVNLSDPSEEAMDGVIEKAEKAGYTGKLKKHSGECISTRSPSSLLTIQTTIPSANLYQNRAYSSSRCPTVASVTKSSRASCPTSLAVTSSSTAEMSILQTPSAGSTNVKTQECATSVAVSAAAIKLPGLALPCALAATSPH